MGTNRWATFGPRLVYKDVGFPPGLVWFAPSALLFGL